MSSTESPISEIPVAPAAAKSATMESLRSFVAGGVGGICAVITGHPFDLVKVRLQTSAPGTYTGSLDVVRKAIATSGPIRGLYQGVSAPLIGVTPMFAVSFWGYDMGKKLVSATSTVERDEKGGEKYSIAQISAAGFFSAIPMTAITAPFERVKVLLQLQGQDGGKKQFNGSFDVVKHLYKTGGVRSVFRGSAATLARDGPGSAAYFATYEYLKRAMTPEGGEIGLGSIMFAGGMAGVSMWVLVFPVDTVKSRLQGSSVPISVGKVIGDVYKSGGIKGFFPGIGPAMMRSFPANAATFVGVEMAYKAWDKVF